MRPLNRPMFKMGGPIKEGIMDGMREPLKNGGLSKQFNTGLVGDERYPKTDGREHHFAFLAPAGMAALRFLPAAYRGFKAARLGSYAPMSQKLGVAGRLKNIFTPTSGIKAPMAPTGAGAGFRLGSFLKQNPLTALPLGGMAIEGGGRAAAGLAKMSPDLLRQYANAVIPFADPFTKKEEVPTKEDGTGLKRGDKKSTVIGDTTTGITKSGQAGGTTVKSDAEKQQINEARIQETKDKYYKLMGIDKMNKDAVYDSLINASQIVQEEGADLKGAIRSGNLQNRIIQAISQNLDKSADLKRQIDAAVLKGEIEKDIKRADPDTAINREYKQSQIDLAKRKLEGPSAADVMSSATIDSKNIVTSNTLEQVLRGFGRDVDYTFPDDKFEKWQKNNKNKDEISYLQENFSTLEDGLYVVNKKAFEIKGGTVFPVNLDKIKDMR